MTRKIKRIFAAVLSAALCFASVSVSAEWRIKDYDTSMGITPSAPIVYQEFDANGLPTGRVVAGYEAQKEGLKGFAEIALKDTWVSDVYPNAEYATLYADGNYTGRVFATGRDGEDLVEYRDVDFMWELAAPYKIYSIRQAKLFKGGAVQWYGTVEKNYPVEYTNRNAAVSSERVAYGFGDFEVTGTNKVALVPDYLKASYMDAKAYTDMVGVNAAMISAKKQPFAPTPVDVTAVANIIAIPRTYDLKLTGPSFDANGNQTPNAVTVYASKHNAPENFAVANLLTTLNDIYGDIAICDITWTPAGFESAKPYRLYEYLTVDGVVMDGSEIAKDVYKPCIYKYTGATANLKHRTVIAGVSANGEVMIKTQVSFNDGITYVDEGAPYGTGIYPNVEYRVEKGVIEGYKTVTPVYVFKYNDNLYNTYEINGEWIVERWGNNAVMTDAPHYVLEQYVG